MIAQLKIVSKIVSKQKINLKIALRANRSKQSPKQSWQMRSPLIRHGEPYSSVGAQQDNPIQLLQVQMLCTLHCHPTTVGQLFVGYTTVVEAIVVYPTFIPSCSLPVVCRVPYCRVVQLRNLLLKQLLQKIIGSKIQDVLPQAFLIQGKNA